jgi:hypothetical protein
VQAVTNLAGNLLDAALLDIAMVDVVQALDVGITVCLELLPREALELEIDTIVCQCVRACVSE